MGEHTKKLNKIKDSVVALRFKIHGIQASRLGHSRFWSFAYFGRTMNSRYLSDQIMELTDPAIKELAEGIKRHLLEPRR